MFDLLYRRCVDHSSIPVCRASSARCRLRTTIPVDVDCEWYCRVTESVGKLLVGKLVDTAEQQILHLEGIIMWRASLFFPLGKFPSNWGKFPSIWGKFPSKKFQVEPISFHLELIFEGNFPQSQGIIRSQGNTSTWNPSPNWGKFPSMGYWGKFPSVDFSISRNFH